MFPTDLFHALVDKQLAFQVVKRNGRGTYSVSRARKGRIRLSAGRDSITGDAGSILARLNALLCDESGRGSYSVTLDDMPSFDSGQWIEYRIITEARGRDHGFAEPIDVISVILDSDYPTVKHQTGVFEVRFRGCKQLYLMELVDDNTLLDIRRLSPRALPKDIHAKLAATGYFEDTFVALYGAAELQAAIEQAELASRVWMAGLNAARAQLGL